MLPVCMSTVAKPWGLVVRVGMRAGRASLSRNVWYSGALSNLQDMTTFKGGQVDCHQCQPPKSDSNSKSFQFISRKMFHMLRPSSGIPLEKNHKCRTKNFSVREDRNFYSWETFVCDMQNRNELVSRRTPSWCPLSAGSFSPVKRPLTTNLRCKYFGKTKNFDKDSKFIHPFVHLQMYATNVLNILYRTIHDIKKTEGNTRRDGWMVESWWSGWQRIHVHQRVRRRRSASVRSWASETVDDFISKQIDWEMSISQKEISKPKSEKDLLSVQIVSNQALKESESTGG